MINKIQNMDCFKGMKLIPDQSLSHTFTSPPYNRKRNDKYKFYDDTLVDYETFLNRVIDEALRISKNYVFLNVQKNYYNKSDVFKIIGKYSDKIIDILIWNKSNPMPASGFNITNAYEFVLVMSNNLSSLKSNVTYTKNLFTTNVYSNNPYTKIHRAVMHPEACRYVLSHFTKEGDSILDPFMGLGTTAIIAKELGRSFTGFELDEQYCKLANERLEEE